MTFVIPVQYQQIIDFILIFADGIIIGAAIKKGIISFILILIGLFIASYVGISFPGVSFELLLSKAINFASYVFSKAPLQFAGLPILFLIGLAIGLWKG
ncbi:MAG: hypothetical protein ACP5LX_03565 [Nitrososphaeria archaeon]|jgi:hypothetical protein